MTKQALLFAFILSAAGCDSPANVETQPVSKAYEDGFEVVVRYPTGEVNSLVLAEAEAAVASGAAYEIPPDQVEKIRLALETRAKLGEDVPYPMVELETTQAFGQGQTVTLAYQFSLRSHKYTYKIDRGITPLESEFRTFGTAQLIKYVTP